MASLPPELAGDVETPLAEWIIDPQTNHGENNLGFSFLNATPHRVIVRIAKLGPPPPPPRCQAEVDWSYDEYAGLQCELELDHEGPHRAVCREWSLSFWLTRDLLSST